MAYGLQEQITRARHLQNMAKILLATGLLVTPWIRHGSLHGLVQGDPYDEFIQLQARPFGPYAHTYWVLISSNCGTPQLLWIPWFRRNVYALFVISLLVNVGMWLERYVIVVTSLATDYLPSSW